MPLTSRGRDDLAAQRMAGDLGRGSARAARWGSTARARTAMSGSSGSGESRSSSSSAILAYASSTASSGTVSPAPALHPARRASRRRGATRARGRAAREPRARRINRACTSSISCAWSRAIVERLVLAVVVARARAPRPRRSSRASSALRSSSDELARAHRAVEQDLDVHLVVGRVDAGPVVDRVGVDAPAGQRVLDPARWVKPRLPPSATTWHRSSRRVDPHAVVRLVADVGVRLGVRLHVGADAAVVEQVDRRPQDRADQLRRRQRRRR